MNQSDLDLAVDLLHDGQIVAFPTETVYGLGANASDPSAINKIYALKGRPSNHPLIIHLADISQIDYWARNIPLCVEQLSQKFWPGPLTLILERGNAPLEVTGGQDSVGIRIPSHPVAQKLLKQFGGGIAAPSANRFGRVSPTQSDHVYEEFGDSIKLILDGGSCQVGLESTILSLVGNRAILLRPGSIRKSDLEATLQTTIESPSVNTTIRASGTLESHYAPETPIELSKIEHLNERILSLTESHVRIAVMSLSHRTTEELAQKNVHHITMPISPDNYGKELYASLRELDRIGVDLILIEKPPEDSEAWLAVHDRLTRAAHKDEPKVS